MKMNVAEMKLEMIGILQMQDKDKIARFYAELYEIMDAPEDDCWDDLNLFQQKQLLKILGCK